jgi:hypothetical protein
MSATASSAEQTAVTYHWIMTVQTNDGRQATNDGRINGVPGVHTHETTFQVVRDAMKSVVETDHFTVVFFSLTPNEL